jgi:hypothetical protein
MGGGVGGGTSGAGADGGAPVGACDEPIVSGPCLAYFPRFAFDAATGECVEFVYGGCDGNGNNFENVGACLARCAGGVDRTACEEPGECTLVDSRCCGCDPTISDLVPVSNFYNEEFPGLLTCPEIVCAECPNTGYSPWFAATCDQGHCRGFDAREDRITECTENDECTLRGGLDCCGCGSDAVAVRRDANLEALFCTGGGCVADCVPTLPAGIQAMCVEGRCSVVSFVAP